MAMKVVRQARLELSGGSTPDLLRPIHEWRIPSSTGAHTYTRNFQRADSFSLYGAPPPPPVLGVSIGATNQGRGSECRQVRESEQGFWTYCERIKRSRFY